MKIIFEVPGQPVGKGRPRFMSYGGRMATYTPKETKMYEDLVKHSYITQVGNKKIDDDKSVSIKIIAYFGIPKSMPKYKQKLALAGVLRPAKKPDWDNIGKIISDSLNGIAYKDDAQIVSAIFEKYYAEEPKVRVEIEEVQEKGNDDEIIKNNTIM